MVHMSAKSLVLCSDLRCECQLDSGALLGLALLDHADGSTNHCGRLHGRQWACFHATGDLGRQNFHGIGTWNVSSSSSRLVVRGYGIRLQAWNSTVNANWCIRRRNAGNDTWYGTRPHAQVSSVYNSRSHGWENAWNHARLLCAKESRWLIQEQWILGTPL